MSPPVVVVDIDDVVFPFIDGMVGYYNQRYAAQLTAADFVSYNFHDVWGCSQEEANEIVDDFLHQSWIELSPIEGAVSALETLSKDFSLVMVTARNGLFRDNTVSWLRRYLLGLFSDAIFVGNHHDGRGYRAKGEICSQLGAQLIIDDHPKNILSATEYGVDGVLFGDRAWSVIDGLPTDRVVACRDWSETLEYIYGHWWR